METLVILGGGVLLAAVVIALMYFFSRSEGIKESDHKMAVRSEAELTKDANGPYSFMNSETGHMLGMDLKEYECLTHPMVLKCDNKVQLRERLQDLRKAVPDFDEKYEVV